MIDDDHFIIAKTDERHVRKSSKGGVTTILTYFFLLLIAWTEFGGYFGGYVDKQYGVDWEVRETVQINMDVYVAMPCQWINVNARDQTMDLKLVSQELVFEEMPFFVPYGTRVNDMNDIVTPDLDRVLGDAIPAEFREKMDTSSLLDEDGKPLFELNACHVYGAVKVNRVAGEIQITAKGYGYRSIKKTPIEDVNFNHVINEFSFGDFYPYIQNPLDATAKIDNDHPFSTYAYFTTVVPTLYQKLGAEVDTNQYSISEYHQNSDPKAKTIRVPGIFFKYNFEPLAIFISDKRLSFIQFTIRLVAIASFVLYVASWIFSAADSFLVTFLGPRWSLRYQKEAANKGLLEK